MDPVLYEERGPIAIITFNREEKLNAMNSQVVSQVIEHLTRANDSEHIRAVILTGKGRAFVAGADIEEYSRQTPIQFTDYQRRSRVMFDKIEKNKKVVIAAVNGYALGGGFELVLSCDLAVASSEAKLGLPEIHLGLLPGGGGTQRLTRLIGERRAKYYMLTGRSLSAQEAFELGVINTVCPAEELMETALQLAQSIASRAPLAVQEGKKLIHDGLDGSLETGITLEGAVIGNLYVTDDAKEGIRAFVEKRKPNFQGS
ncbi:enoyl-CoA hydratase/isomerase family protein [Ammoniphilus resinae]|uniref:Enoyl-CoA hydratase/carnithine racemase n=1 Tax=Ammoniphilus resinae TaxID=861532 RepID=A0ABS4GW05_9BACL|nr:enoyl-CoA hydratase/isomerase family protein [Ammoniphilus resinae]MBP1934460.1 enoyl-CoA hydratase/carnithine racemase [Ammoniphilus resinae]